MSIMALPDWPLPCCFCFSFAAAWIFSMISVWAAIAGLGGGELVGRLVHDALHLVEQRDDLRDGLLDGELLDVGGKLVLLVGDP
jgi:hypothetical protein